MKCKHKTGSVMEYHGNVSLSECDYGCGAIIVTVTDDNGISHEFTADELVTMRQFVAKVDIEAQTVIDNENSHVSMYFDAMQQNEQLRAQLAAAGECEWKYDEGPTWDYWQGSCGVEWSLIDGTPAENKMNYCPSCGKKLVEAKTQEVN